MSFESYERIESEVVEYAQDIRILLPWNPMVFFCLRTIWSPDIICWIASSQIEISSPEAS